MSNKYESKPKLSPNGLSVLITIVNSKKANFYIDFIQSFDVNMQFSSLADGTAKPGMLANLDLTDDRKVVIFSVVRDDRVKEIMRALDEKFKTIRNGNGIAFTVPMSSVIGVSIYGFLSNNRMMVKETEKNG